MNVSARIVAVGTAVLALASPASAEVGVGVGPARQYLSTEGPTEVYVVNRGDERVRFDGRTVVSSAGRWEELLTGLTLRPSHFRLDPGEQRTVRVISSLPLTEPCSLYGAIFTARVGETTSGVVVEGSAVAQLLLRDDGASDADCLAVIPAPDVPAAASNEISWGWLAIPLVGLIALGIVWQRKPAKVGRVAGF